MTGNLPRLHELRHDPLSDRWTVMAPARSGRPHTTRAAPLSPPSAESCPFCPGNESKTPSELARAGPGEPGTHGWRVRVFPNLYPIVDGEIGTHEIVALSPGHFTSLAGLTDDGAVELFDVLADRMRVHATAGHVYSQAIVNHGREAGASIEHPHAQLLALHLAPPVIVDEATRLRRDSCVMCTMTDRDLLVVDSEAPAWCPWASAFPYEVLIAPREHVGSFENGPAIHRAAAARSVRRALARLIDVLGDAPYNLVVHTATAEADDFHWHVHVWPRIANLAGFELGTGIGANTVLPETAAAELRGVSS